MVFKQILLITASLFFFFINNLKAQEVLEWRGADRTGKYNETGLLKKWPEAGPALLWENKAIGNGYGSPIITNKNIFVNGEIDTICYLFALDLKGKLLWKSKIGTEWILNYPGARTTPTLVGDLIYVETGMGTLSCFESASGKLKWSVNLFTDLHGGKNRFGFAESLLIEDNKVFCTPGGKDTNVVALDRMTGKILWICKGLGQIPAYCSPIIIHLKDKNILVTFSGHALLGIDIKDGKLLWSHPQQGDGDVHVNTPLYENGYIYYITGDGNGAVKLKLSDDGNEITQIWRNPKSDNCMGGFVKIGDYIYTPGYEHRYYYSEDEKTGILTDSVKFDRGTIDFADGMLYLYNEKGHVGLFKPEGSKMEMVSSFEVTKGTKAHFAHPVICKGILYIRHGSSLLAYDVKSK